MGCLVLFLASFLFCSCSSLSLPPSFGDDVKKILAVSGSRPTGGWDRLSLWVDSVGPRLSGSKALENGIDMLLDLLQKEGFSNVHSEPAVIPRWERGQESLRLLQPFEKSLALLGLGTSVGCDNITASVFVASNFSSLTAQNVRGKIVVWNPACDWDSNPDYCYGHLVQYRSRGASVASQYGAVASLCRSLTGHSLYTPHTGVQQYDDHVQPIPSACITVEDTDLMQRLQDRGTPVVVTLHMEARNFAPVTSRNVIAELLPSQSSSQSSSSQWVFMGGHTDSWDVGQGAEDDGAGVMVVLEAMSLLQRAHLQHRLRRPIRLLGWVCEEFGGIGAQQYFDAHKSEAANVSVVLESDLGIFQPYGLQFGGVNAQSRAMMQQILSYASSLNATRLVGGGGGEDSGPWIAAGVPGASPFNDARKYFDYHHTNADMMTHVPKEWFQQSATLLAIVAYGVASLDDLLPR